MGGVTGVSPEEDDVLQTFIKWLNAERRTVYAIEQRPDRSVRTRQEIDYLLRDTGTGDQIAVEISSTWRSRGAGGEDAKWLRWTEQVETLLQGKISGQFQVWTPLRIPRGLSPAAFAGQLEELLRREATNIEARGRGGKHVPLRIQGLDIHVAHVNRSGSDMTFGRKLQDAETRDFSNQVRRILEAKGPKLKHHKVVGRETWLVIFNTFWTAMRPYDVQQVFLGWLGPDYKHVDNIGVVSGNPPLLALHENWVLPPSYPT